MSFFLQHSFVDKANTQCSFFSKHCYLWFGELLHALLFVGVELLPTERIYEHGVLLEVLLQGALLPQQVSVLIVDEDLLVLQVVDGLVVDIVHGVGVVQGVGWTLLPANKKQTKLSIKKPKKIARRHMKDR